MEKIEVIELPLEDSLDYKCLITCEETDKVGGYKFKAHKSLSDYLCDPIYVLSKEGYESLIKQENCFCPICYTSLSKYDFEEVEPKKNKIIEVFSKDFKYPFGNSTKIESKVEINNKTENINNNISKNNNTGTLIVMVGCVGSGKSTLSNKIQQELEEKGYFCINEGTDKYCKTGMSSKDAYNKISNILKNINGNENKKIVVIIDACNENFNKSNVFGVNFSNWKILKVYPNYNKSNMKGYLAWTLRNVLLRTSVKEDSTGNYWLNPVDTSCAICVNVHYKKASAIFGKKNIEKLAYVDDISKVLKSIENEANNYEEYLKNNMTIDQQVTKILNDMTIDQQVTKILNDV